MFDATQEKGTQGKCSCMLECYCRKCELGEDICWFNHSKELKTELSTCNTCGEVSKTLNDLQHPKKRDHMLTVPPCKNAIKGSCWHGNDKCWFRHAETETCNEPNIINKNQD